MKEKALNIGLVLTSLIGYLEWGEDNHSFIFQTEGEIIAKLIQEPMSVMHPLVLIPLIGQILLIITLFQKTVSKRLTFAGIGTMAILLVLMFAIGIMGTNIKIMASTAPFIALSVYTIITHQKRSRNQND